MKNIALITAKGGNVTIENKNLIEVEGKTFLGWQITAAKESKYIDEVFVSTECPNIKKESNKYNAVIIERPIDLAQPFTNHGDAILHGAKSAQDILREEIGIVTILLGNTVMNIGADIDASIEALISNPMADSSMTVWQAQDDHPYRAMTIGDDGFLQSFLEIDNADTNRQSYPEVYFYDQGPWSVRYSALIASKRNETGPVCWWWMGNNSMPIIRNWVTGKDTHTQLDVEVARLWLKYGLRDV